MGAPIRLSPLLGAPSVRTPPLCEFIIFLFGVASHTEHAARRRYKKSTSRVSGEPAKGKTSRESDAKDET
jgi:hypothetical protein